MGYYVGNVPIVVASLVRLFVQNNILVAADLNKYDQQSPWTITLQISHLPEIIGSIYGHINYLFSVKTIFTIMKNTRHKIFHHQILKARLHSSGISRKLIAT